MNYLAIFIWHGDDGATWSTEVYSSDKDHVVRALLHKGAHHSLEYAEILLIENGRQNNNFHSDPMAERYPPKIIAHWSALNGDF